LFSTAEQLNSRGTDVVDEDDLEGLSGEKIRPATPEEIQRLVGRGDINYFRDLLQSNQAKNYAEKRTPSS